MPGLFLALEGSDGSGKSSQIELLEGFFRKSGSAIATVHFPRLDAQPYGPLIAQFLRGELGSVDAVHPKLAALLYALDRKEFAPQIRELVHHGAILLADRYIFSNIAYQCAKTRGEHERAALADWIERLEYGAHAIPRPDLTLYLDVPPEFSRQNLQKQRTGADREYLGGKQDIHEASDDLQTRVREEFLALAKARSGEICVVDCRGENGGIASRAVIHSRIIDKLRYFGIIAR